MTNILLEVWKRLTSRQHHIQENAIITYYKGFVPYLMTARQSLSPVYVTTYRFGAQNSNSLSQLMMVDSGAPTKKGPLQ